ncbi:MAG: hypothetical protein NC131_17240, partial [Roseburia sp.]|nr:hypothetical protein [Roseburia sp.]
MKRRIATMLAVCTLATSITIPTFAADQGWVQENNVWHYKNAKGENVTDAWKVWEPDGRKYYLDEDGNMLTDTLFDINDKWYHVNEYGTQTINSWRLLNNEDYDEEDRWYYFDGGGKAYEKGWKQIDGKYYHFTDSTMDYGWLTEDGEMIDEDEEDAWEEAVYYTGDNTTGWRFQSEWVKVEEFDTDYYPDHDVVWLWFGNNGKKVSACTKRINNKYYAFDENGAMCYEWAGSATPSDATYRYYDEMDGSQKRGGWFQAIPSEEQDQEKHDDEEYMWFYANNSGTTYKDGIKTISGKKYLFDKYGINRRGLLIVNENKKLVKVLEDDPEDYPNPNDLHVAHTMGDIMLTDEKGAILTGKKTVTLDGEKYTMNFTKQGIAIHGEDKGYLYDAGVLIKANKKDDG